MSISNDIAYALLAAAIITRAKKDVKNNPNDYDDEYSADEFLKSNWCSQLTDLCAISYEKLTKNNAQQFDINR